MAEKKKFNPEVTRVVLNPEQAVFACTCYDSGFRNGGSTYQAAAWMCNYYVAKNLAYDYYPQASLCSS